MSEYNRPPSFDFGAAIGQGFNLPGGKRYLVSVAAWSALIVIIIYALFGIPIIKAFGSMMTTAIEMEDTLGGAEPDVEQLMAIMRPMFGAFGLIFLIGLLQMAVFAAAETALYRNILHGENIGVFPLRFGTDELRVLGTRIVVGFILSAIYFVAYIVGIIIAGLLIAAAGATGSSALGAIGGLLVFVLFVGGFAAFIWVAVKLAPASAYSVKLRTFNPFASWHPMKGRVWPAIGSYLVLYIVGYIILTTFMYAVFISLFLSSGIMGVLGDLESSPGETPNFSALSDFFTSAGFIIPTLIAVFLVLFLSLIWYGTIWSMWGYVAKDEDEAWQPATFD